jgi:hypothetical protein
MNVDDGPCARSKLKHGKMEGRFLGRNETEGILENLAVEIDEILTLMFPPAPLTRPR